MLAEERRQAILSLIQENGSARTADLAERYRVSDQTIRRDLLDLEEKKLIRKHHGGGVLINYRGAAYGERTVLRREEKQLVAREAVRHVEAGMTVALGPGTTTEEIARQINGHDVRVITNSLAVARVLSNPTTRVQLTGGHYRPGSELVAGDVVGRYLEELFADITFFGVSGIGSEAGYTVTEPDEAAVLRWFIRIAKRSVAVTDSSKFQRIAKARVAPLQAVHTLITDDGIPPTDRTLLDRHGVEVIAIDRTLAPAGEDP